MELQELKSRLKERLAEVEEKLNEVEKSLKEEDKPSDTLKDIHEQLKAKKDDIIIQYDQIEAMKTADEVRLPELEKNIYNSLKSFDTAYNKAGAFIEENKFRNRSRSVDFKNPQDTK